jgi:hypothetical protein
MATSSENIISALLDLAIDNGKIYAKTKNMLYKEREVYLRRLAVSFTDFSGEVSDPTLQEVTDNGSTTTNSITANAFIKSGGTSAQFLKADGSVDNNVYLTATSLNYGAFYDNTDQTIASAYEEKTVNINSMSYSNGISLLSNQLLFAIAGTYDIQVSLQVTNHYNQDQDFYLWFAYNGTAISESLSIVTVPSTHGGIIGHNILSMNLFQQVNPGDTIEMRWTGNHPGIRIETISPGFGTLPNAPSVIITATQV